MSTQHGRARDASPSPRRDDRNPGTAPADRRRRERLSVSRARGRGPAGIRPGARDGKRNIKHPDRTSTLKFRITLYGFRLSL